MQVGRLAHTSNLAMHEPGVRLAERLVALLDLPARVFFANSGAEANECALKLARKHRPGRRIVACHGSFHGRTHGRAVDHRQRRPSATPFEPLPGPVTFVDYGDVDALRARGRRRHRRGVRRTDPGRGRRRPRRRPGSSPRRARSATPPARCWSSTRCRAASAAPGTGSPARPRASAPTSSRWPRASAAGCRSAPASASGAAAELFAPGDHGSTFGGNPVSCAAALAVLDTIDQRRPARQRQAGRRAPRRTAWTRWTARWSPAPRQRPVARARPHRGEGRCGRERPPATAACWSTRSSRTCIRLAPPLILTEADVDAARAAARRRGRRGRR